jgi:prephenate dehydratase
MCRFLEQHNWKLIETEDTALSAQQIHKKRSPHIAGIASKLAADLFDLEILTSIFIHKKITIQDF